MTPSICLHLDEVCLYGVAPRDRDRVAAAVAGELTRLFTVHGVPDALRLGGSVERLDAGAFAVDSSLTVDRYGERVAQALFRSLGGRIDP
jgi:hypothetical protein